MAHFPLNALFFLPAQHTGPLPMDAPTPLPFYNDLDESLAEAWRLLSRGVADRRSPFHTVTVASLDAHGHPDARTVVFRAVCPSARTLRFHTDQRAPKAKALQAHPVVTLLFYDPGRKIQLRLQGHARVEAEGPTADAAWDATRLFSRRCYLAPRGPGQASAGPTSGLPTDLEQREPEKAESEAGRAHFCIVEVTVHRLDWLYLAHAGHRRAIFDWRDDGGWTGRWCVP